MSHSRFTVFNAELTSSRIQVDDEHHIDDICDLFDIDVNSKHEEWLEKIGRK